MSLEEEVSAEQDFRDVTVKSEDVYIFTESSVKHAGIDRECSSVKCEEASVTCEVKICVR